MNRPPAKFDWNDEPPDAGPSEFMPSSGYAATSGYHAPHDLAHPGSARPRRRRGAAVLVGFCLALLVAGGYALSQFAASLRG